MSLSGVYGDQQMVAADMLMEYSLGITSKDTAKADVRKARILLEEMKGKLEMMLVRAVEGIEDAERIEEALKRCEILEKYLYGRMEDCIN